MVGTESNVQQPAEEADVDDDAKDRGIEMTEEQIIANDGAHASQEVPYWRNKQKRNNQQDWSLKDMWTNYDEIEDMTQVFWPLLKCTSIVLGAVLIAFSFTYAAYRLSDSSMSVNRPWMRGGELRYE